MTIPILNYFTLAIGIASLAWAIVKMSRRKPAFVEAGIGTAAILFGGGDLGGHPGPLSIVGVGVLLITCVAMALTRTRKTDS